MIFGLIMSELMSDRRHDNLPQRVGESIIRHLTYSKALVRRITETQRSSDGKCFDGKPEVGCYVQWLEQSACGNRNELFLVHGVCANVRLSSIVSVQPIYIGTRGPIEDRPFLKYVTPCLAPRSADN